MKHYKFKDLDSDIEGVVVNLLNPIVGVGNEVSDMVVKYLCPKENIYLNRFRNFNEVILTEITENIDISNFEVHFEEVKPDSKSILTKLFNKFKN